VAKFGPTKQSSVRINAEPLLVSRVDYTIIILFCPLVLVVNIDSSVCTKTCLICKEHWWNKEILSILLSKTWIKVLLRWKIGYNSQICFGTCWYGRFFLIWYVELVLKVCLHLLVTSCIVQWSISVHDLHYWGSPHFRFTNIISKFCTIFVILSRQKSVYRICMCACEVYACICIRLKTKYHILWPHIVLQPTCI
jgi:hypothetical protein